MAMFDSQRVLWSFSHHFSTIFPPFGPIMSPFSPSAPLHACPGWWRTSAAPPNLSCGGPRRVFDSEKWMEMIGVSNRKFNSIAWIYHGFEWRYIIISTIYPCALYIHLYISIICTIYPRRLKSQNIQWLTVTLLEYKWIWWVSLVNRTGILWSKVQEYGSDWHFFVAHPKYESSVHL